MEVGVGLSGLDGGRVAVGLLTFLAPGFVWAWVLFRDRGWISIVPLAIVLAFSLGPGLLTLLNMVLGVPINLAVSVYLSGAMAAAGLARWWASKERAVRA